MDGFAYIDCPRTGDENMAIDRELLEKAERDRCAWLRIYRWSEPTLSLGHFQSDANRTAHPASANLTRVKRASGGGAIVHDREWTYAVALPLSRNRVGAATELYDCIHDCLVRKFRDQGWRAAKWSSACKTAIDAEMPADGQSFLCFQRRSCGDIICGPWKIVGSAQRRLGTSVLQHGSILCGTSPFAPELCGLADLPRIRINRREIPGVSQPPLFSKQLENSELDNETFGKLVISWILDELIKRFEISFRQPDGGHIDFLS